MTSNGERCGARSGSPSLENSRSSGSRYANGRRADGVVTAVMGSHRSTRNNSPVSLASMEENDYAMLTEALREVRNPLVFCGSGGTDVDDDLTFAPLATSAAHRQFLRDWVSTDVQKQGANEEQSSAAAAATAADWQERRALRRCPGGQQQGEHETIVPPPHSIFDEVEAKDSVALFTEPSPIVLLSENGDTRRSGNENEEEISSSRGSSAPAKSRSSPFHPVVKTAKTEDGKEGEDTEEEGKKRGQGDVDSAPAAIELQGGVGGGPGEAPEGRREGNRPRTLRLFHKDPAPAEEEKVRDEGETVPPPRKRIKLSSEEKPRRVIKLAGTGTASALAPSSTGTAVSVFTPTGTGGNLASFNNAVALKEGGGSVVAQTPSPFSPLGRQGQQAGNSSTPHYDIATPTPLQLGSAPASTVQKTTRPHPQTRVPIPLSPPSINFSNVRRTVEAFYSIEDKISEGTYGEVYVGTEKATGERVALKRLKVLKGLDGFPLTSLREVIALQHINEQRRKLAEAKGKSESEVLSDIVVLKDVLLSAHASHDIYLIFPYATSSVAGLLVRHRDFFSLDEIVFLFRRLIISVSQLHEMGIIHRDIKADNVLITENGDVQLADFGLCAFRGGGDRALTPSMINLSYRPPEMLLGGTAYDEKVDVWSIGCFLAQVFVREPPFSRRRTAAEREQLARSSRSAETELQQLAIIANVLGPLPQNVFSKQTCKHLEALEAMRHSARHLDPIFTSGFLFQQFHGFGVWFQGQLEHRGSPLTHHPHRQLVIDVLKKIFQYDPKLRPTAAELLEMPLFTQYGQPDQEANTRAKLVLKLRQSAGSHIAPKHDSAKRKA